MEEKYFELQCRYSGHNSYYTYGTKTDTFVGCAMVDPSVRCVKRIAYAATILIAEICGLRLAVDYIVKTKKHAVNRVH